MKYDVVVTHNFKKLFKKLAKKYPSLKDDLRQLIDILSENPTTGTNLGYNVFKIRLAVTSKRKGKSGGARVTTLAVVDKYEVYLVHIYDKSQLDNLKKDQILLMLEKAGLK